jgi:hypothetical protein
MTGGCKPRMAGCAATCGHYLFVSDYHQERQRWEAAREAYGNGYPVESAAFEVEHPGPTLRQWMLARVGKVGR